MLQLDAASIKTELHQILESKAFKSSPLLTRFLTYVVNKTLEGQEHQIKEYTIGLDVLGKAGDFKDKPDASVRINAIRLRKMLDEYYQQPDTKASIRIELPKGSYRPVFSKFEPEPVDTNLLPKPTRNGSSADSICIVPFKELIAIEVIDFSVNGFCEYLSEKLALFQDITVVAYNSIKFFLDNGGQLQQLNENFGIQYYVTGSIELSPHFLLISIELIDAESGLMIWSEHIQTPMQESHAFTDCIRQVTTKIVSSIAGYSGRIHFKKYANVNTLPDLNNKVANAVFWFYRYNAYHTYQHFKDAIESLEAIVEDNDPSCSLCYAVLAHLYGDSIFYNYATKSDPLKKTQEYIDRAMALDPNQQHAFLAKGWLEILTGTWENARISADKMLAINPNSPFFLSIYSLANMMLCDFEKSLQYWQKAIQLNPLPYWWLNVPIFIYALKTGNFQEALFYARKNTTPKGIYEHILEMIALYYMHDLEQVAKIKKVYQEKFPDQLSFVVRAFPTIFQDKKISNKLSKALVDILALPV